MTADPHSPEPLPGLTLGGVTVSEAIRMQGEARGREEGWHWPSPSRSAIITLWIVGLIAAVAIASYAQMLSQRNAAAAMDAPPPPPEAASSVPTTPVQPEPAAAPSAPIVADAGTAA